MFSRTREVAGGKSARRNESFSVIGPDVVVTGDITTGENLQVSGRIDGDVRCASLQQDENSAIAGHIVAHEARLAGKVDGTVIASVVAIEASARVTGEITYTTLSIEGGARVEGKLVHREEEVGGPVAGEVSFNEIFPHEDTVRVE